MRNKVISFIALTVFIVGAFLMPLTAYAAELPADTEPPAIEAVEADIEAEPDETADTDIDITDLDADGMAEFMALLQLFSMLGASDAQESESAIPQGSPKAFTPDGQATVVDWDYGWYDSKEFYTFSTPAGNVFYLIIDHAKANNNVYFLNAVTESDLMSLAEKAGDPISESAIPATTKPKTDPAGDEPGETEPPDGEAVTPPKESGGNSGMIIFVVLAVIALGGAGYYIKIVRPKQQASGDDDEDEPENDDNDRDYPYEDETENGDDTGNDDGSFDDDNENYDRREEKADE